MKNRRAAVSRRSGQRHVDDLPVPVHGPVQVAPPAGDLDVGVGSGRGAVSVFRLIRFLGPPAEPDVPLGRPFPSIRLSTSPCR